MVVHDEVAKYKSRQKQRFPHHFCELPYTADRVFPMLSPINPTMGKRLKLGLLHMLTAWRMHPYISLMRPSNYTIEMEQVVHVRSRAWWLIHPLSSFWMVWTLMVTLTNIMVLLLLPLYEGFMHTQNVLMSRNDTGKTPYVSWLDKNNPVTVARYREQNLYKKDFRAIIDVCEGVFIIHILFKFFVGYINFQRNTIIMNHNRIMKRYVVTWFFPDIISAVPLEGFNVMIAYHNQEDLVDYLNPRKRQLLYIYLVVYTLRLIRLYEIYQTIRIWCSFYSLSIVYTYYLFYAIFFVIYIQWSSFYLVRVAFLVEGPWLFAPNWRSWLSDPVMSYLELNRTIPFMKQYFTAVHLVTQAYGSFSPFSTQYELALEDVIIMLVVMWLAQMFNLVLFALIMRQFSIQMFPVVKFQRVMATIELYGLTTRLPKQLRSRILLYYKHRFQLFYYNERSIIMSFTMTVRKEVLQYEGSLKKTGVKKMNH